jgi:UDP-N-acetylglucosamine transferase subunit ALG13
MVLVLLGTQNNSFHRLLEEVEKNIENGNIKGEVIVQAGYTKFESDKMKIFDLISSKEIENLIQKSQYVIAHGGVGTIINCLKREKKVIAVARRAEYHEHVNNHQTEIVGTFNEKGYIIGIDDANKLENAIKKLDKFTPQKYESGTSKIIKLVEDFIDNN